MSRTVCLSAAFLSVTLALTACQQGPTPAQQAAAKKAALEAAAHKKLEAFKQLDATGSPDLAAAQGRLILDNYAGTAAAASVAKVLPALEARVAASREQRRLKGLWLYQVGPMAGGTQSTASIYNSKPATVRVHLVLRRHTKWGTSVFLYDAPDGGFVCHRECRLVMHFDGQRHVYTGYRPDGGEPAMFIKQTDGFIARLAKTGTLTMTVHVKGRGEQTLVYETAGYQPDQWKQVAKKQGH